jgi:small-conductance mechanosensitive channel
MILLAQHPSWLAQLTLVHVLECIVIISVTVLLIRFVQKTLEGLGEAAPRSRFFFKTVIPIIGFVLWLLAASSIAGILAPSTNTILAMTASLGIALGLGAQDLVKNLIGGLIILTDRPYQLGDRVQIGDATGEIDHIGLRSTKMTNFDDTRITIPNSEVMTGKIWNSNSGVPDEQVFVDIYVDAAADPYEVLRIGYEAAYCSPYLYLSKPVVCLVSDKFDQRPYMRLRIKGYVYDHRAEPRFQSDITARAKSELRRRRLLPGMVRFEVDADELGSSSPALPSATQVQERS